MLPWIPGLQLELAFRMDALAWVMSLLILGVGALVLVYCARYFKTKDDYLGGFGAQLLAFAGAMFGLVTADDLLLMFIFWELTTVLSYLLIGYARTRLSARRSALQALIVTTAGGLAMLVGLIMLGFSAGTYRISAILEQAPALVTGPAGARSGRRRRTHPDRCHHQVGPGPLPFLAPRRDGSADPGQRLPACRGHGEGRHLPRGAAGPRDLPETNGSIQGDAVRVQGAKKERPPAGRDRLVHTSVTDLPLQFINFRDPNRLTFTYVNRDVQAPQPEGA